MNNYGRLLIYFDFALSPFSVKSHNALVRHLKLLQNTEDFELKKLLINILVILSRDPSSIPVSLTNI